MKTEQDIDPRLDLAVERTALALERTQLAWGRTVISFITAGLAIDKGTAALHEARLVSGHAWAKNGHFGGLLLTLTATILMIMVTVAYVKRMRNLNKIQGLKAKQSLPTTLLSVFVCLVGLLAFVFLHLSW